MSHQLEVAQSSSPVQGQLTSSDDNAEEIKTDGLDIDDFFSDIPHESDDSSSHTTVAETTSLQTQYLDFEGRIPLKSSLVTAILTAYYRNDENSTCVRVSQFEIFKNHHSISQLGIWKIENLSNLAILQLH